MGMTLTSVTANVPRASEARDACAGAGRGIRTAIASSVAE
jgi:hypothetical protein